MYNSSYEALDKVYKLQKALIAPQVRGIGPETAFRILGKMHYDEDEFYMDLLKAKIQYLRTQPYWEDKENFKKQSVQIGAHTKQRFYTNEFLYSKSGYSTG